MHRTGFVILFFVLLLSSCRARKEHISSSVDEELIRRIECFIWQRDSIVSTKKEIHHLNEWVEIIERKFDTTQQPDSLGNYPVISEKITNINKNDNSVVEENTEQVSVSGTDVVDNQNINKKQDVVIDKEVKESTSFRYLVLLGVLVISAIVFVFLKQIGIFRKSC